MPSAVWAQRKEVVFLSFLLHDVKGLDLKIEADKLHFSGKSDDKQYSADLELFAEVDPEKSKYVVKDRLIDVTLQKKNTEAAFWPRLLKASGKAGWLKTDFGRWKDEDDEETEDAPGGPGGDGADFQSMMHQMGGMGGGMGGMGGGMGGFGGAGDGFDPNEGDSDDQEPNSDDTDDIDDMPKLE